MWPGRTTLAHDARVICSAARGQPPMCTSQRVSRGFHRLAVFLAVIPSLALPTAISAQADEEKAQFARLMYSAFQCATFAELAEKPEESARLSGVGIQAGHVFLEALQTGKISKDELHSKVPVGVLLDLGGPSIDFVIGRISAHAGDAAFDKIVKENEAMTLETKDLLPARRRTARK